MVTVDGSPISTTRARSRSMARASSLSVPPPISQRASSRRADQLRRSIVIPGLINTHSHAPMVFYRGLADDLRLQEWLEKYIFPAEAKTVSRELVRAGTRLAALEMIQSGTTAYADMYYFEEEIARATKAAGMRGVLGQTIIQFPVADAKTPQEGLSRTEAFIKEFAKDDLIVPAVAPHSPYTLDAKDLLARARWPRVRSSGSDPCRRDRTGTRELPESPRGMSAGRLSAIDRLLGAANGGESRCMGERGGYGHSAQSSGSRVA